MKRKLLNLKFELIGRYFAYFISGGDYKKRIKYSVSIHCGSNYYNDFDKYISLYIDEDGNICQICFPKLLSQSKFYDILYEKHNTLYRSKLSKATIQEIDRYFKLASIS